MKIHVGKLKVIRDKFAKQLSEYEDNYLNLFNEIKSLSFAWTDGKANRFQELARQDKNNIIKNYLELNEYYKDLNYMINSYDQIGKEIYASLPDKDYISKKFDDLLEYYEDVLGEISKIDLSLCPNSWYVTDGINKLQEAKKELINCQTNIIKMIERIEEIEKRIKELLGELNIEYMKECVPNDYV